MPSTHPCYQYSPLPKGHVRLLKLLPGGFEDELAGELTAVDLADCTPESKLSFEAVSYVWGSPEKPFRLFTPGGSVISLTASLHSLLRRIRLPHESRLLWADALCINQRDTAEKGEQVALMALIYNSARRVLADLGEAADDTWLALAAIDRYWRLGARCGIDEHLFGRWLTPTQTASLLGVDLKHLSGSSIASEAPSGGAAMDAAEREAVARLLGRPWFTRVWIIQEFVLAREVVMLCGMVAVDWRHLFAVCLAYQGLERSPAAAAIDGQLRSLFQFWGIAFLRCVRRLTQHAEGRALLELLSAFSEGRMARHLINPSLSTLLSYFRGSQATLPRDRYFALLKISSDYAEGGDSITSINPDYAAPADQIVLRFAMLLIRGDGAAEMFARSGLWRQKNINLPSWVDDFTVERSPAADAILVRCSHKPAGDGGFEVVSHPNLPGVIRVKAYHAGTIMEQMVAQPSLADSSGLLERMAGNFDHHILQGVRFFQEHSDLIGERCQGRPVHPTTINIARAMALTLSFGGDAICPRRDTESVFWSAFFWTSSLIRSPEFLEFLSLREFASLGEELVIAALKEMVLDGATDLLGLVLGGDFTPAITDEGYFANVPSVARNGDQVWIVQGCSFPMVLRKQEDRDHASNVGMFQLVGPCYVHGLMNGEALQRPGFSFDSVTIC
ncbi:hypothetical protein MAPG_10626 [Magnaporthiopsis poae ATCC 64411]|uniref:Heterokaryon incompatibility domain-containing protein n=1 Tax=Magnaporthiopsis poae (strain ATCC 64411 / 73-15) TaxID=644358 RepID=A0A0C4ED33_MAGP6|nr:hypothetical protein MAPG_10626 [Magnaporthiopsis poae ATCC 64411]